MDGIGKCTECRHKLNAGISIEESLRSERPYEFGEEPITLQKVDQVALQLIPDLPADEMTRWMSWMAHYVSKSSKQWRNLKHFVDENMPSSETNDGGIILKRLRAQDGITQTVLLCSAIAQRHAGKTISDVVQVNFEKLESRKAAGQPITKLPHTN